MFILKGRMAAIACTIVGYSASVSNAPAANVAQSQQIERENWMLQMCPRFGALLQEVYGYPRPSSQSQQSTAVRSNAVNRALQDELFVPVFGKGFDKLVSQEVELLDAAVSRCNRDYKQGKPDETYYILQYQERMLKDVFSTNRFQVNVQQVVKSRESAAALGRFVKEMGELPVSAQSVQRLDVMSREAADLVAAAPDSASGKAFRPGYEKTRIRIEIPVERDAVSSRISDSRGYAGLQLVLQTHGQLQLKLNSEKIAQINSSRRELIGLLEKKISSLDAEQAAAELVAYRVFAAESTGLAAMVEAKSREANLEKMYGAQLNAPEFTTFNQERRKFRERLIEQNVGAFSNAVLTVDTMSKVKDLTKKYLVDADLKSVPTGRWVQVVQQRRTQLLMGMNTDGLNYANDVESIFTGDFDEVKIKNNGTDMDFMVGAYIDSFWKRCPAFLPANKVQIMDQVCAAGYTTTTTGPYGVVSSSDTCTRYVSVPTGVWADPEMLSLHGRVQVGELGNFLGNFLQNLTKALNDPLGTVGSMVSSEVKMSQDMDRFLAQNSCASPVTKKFQANLIRFGNLP